MRSLVSAKASALLSRSWRAQKLNSSWLKLLEVSFRTVVQYGFLSLVLPTVELHWYRRHIPRIQWTSFQTNICSIAIWDRIRSRIDRNSSTFQPYIKVLSILTIAPFKYFFLNFIGHSCLILPWRTGYTKRTCKKPIDIPRSDECSDFTAIFSKLNWWYPYKLSTLAKTIIHLKIEKEQVDKEVDSPWSPAAY